MVKKHVVVKKDVVAVLDGKIPDCTWHDCCRLESNELVLIRGVGIEDGQVVDLDGGIALPFCNRHILFAKEGMISAVIRDGVFTGQVVGQFDLVKTIELVTSEYLKRVGRRELPSLDEHRENYVD